MIQMFMHSRDVRVEVEDMVRVYVWTLDCGTLREIYRRSVFPFIRWCIIRSIRTKYLRDVQSLSFSSFFWLYGTRLSGRAPGTTPNRFRGQIHDWLLLTWHRQHCATAKPHIPCVMKNQPLEVG